MLNLDLNYELEAPNKLIRSGANGYMALILKDHKDHCKSLNTDMGSENYFFFNQ